MKEAVLRRLSEATEKGEAGRRYREALEFKLSMYVSPRSLGNGSAVWLIGILTWTYCRLEREQTDGLKTENVVANVEKARKLMLEFESLLSPSSASTASINGGPSPNEIDGHGPWLFGLDHPTALDAHLIFFIARMRDVGRDGLIPQNLGRYGDVGMEKGEWKELMRGRRTMVGK
jgi:hypothetical protein